MNQLKRFVASPLVMLVSVLIACELRASAATYNFYFNNTEQGDNSTAVPNVVVTGGGKEGAQAPSKNLIQSDAGSKLGVLPGTSDSAASPSKSTAVLPADAIAEADARHFRITGSVVDVLGSMGASVGLGYFFNREFGFHAYAIAVDERYGLGNAGWAGGGSMTRLHGGLEMEVTPVRIAVGRIEDLLDLGGMLGVSTIGADSGNWVSPHIGARLNVNLGRSWGLTTVARINASYAMAEAGLAFRF